MGGVVGGVKDEREEGRREGTRTQDEEYKNRGRKRNADGWNARE